MKNAPSMNSAVAMDLFAWLRLMVDPHHRASFFRAYNVPKRNLNQKNFLNNLADGAGTFQPHETSKKGNAIRFNPLNGCAEMPNSTQSCWNAMIRAREQGRFSQKVLSDVYDLIRLRERCCRYINGAKSWEEGYTGELFSVSDIVLFFAQRCDFIKFHVKKNQGGNSDAKGKRLSHFDDFSHYAKKFVCCEEFPSPADAIRFFFFFWKQKLSP